MPPLLPWHIWLIIGIVCVIIEIFDPAFFFLALGVGAIGTSLLSLLPFVQSHIVVQLLLFAIISFITFLLMRKLGKKVMTGTEPETNVYALKGQTGIVTKEIPAHGKGYVKIGGEEWTAISEDGSSIALDERVEILGVEGNKVIVKPESKD